MYVTSHHLHVMSYVVSAVSSAADIIKESIKPYNIDDSNTFKSVIEFECRGLEPIEFDPRVRQLRNLSVIHVCDTRTFI